MKVIDCPLNVAVYVPFFSGEKDIFSVVLGSTETSCRRLYFESDERVVFRLLVDGDEVLVKGFVIEIFEVDTVNSPTGGGVGIGNGLFARVTIA